MTIKKADVLIIGCVLLAAIAAGAFFWFRSPGARAVVTVDGEEYAVYDLAVDMRSEIRTALGTNVLVIEHGSAYIASADCPDGLCVGQGRISREGQMLVCLPHRLTVEITGTAQTFDAVSH